MPLSIVQVQKSVLPDQAATSAKQPAPGVAGTPSTDVITVQGIAGGTPQPVSGTVTVSGTVPVSLASQPLPTGAATSAKQPSLGVSGTPSVDVISVQGIAGGTPQSISGTVAVSGTVPVSGTVGISGTVPMSLASQPLPTGASTEATSATRLADATFTGRINTMGQKTMDASTPVTIASDQSPLAVTVSGSLAVTGPLTLADLRSFAATLWVTATGTQNTNILANLPSPGVGLFHYIVSIELVKLYAAAGTASGAGLIISASNLPGNPSWTVEQTNAAAGNAVKVIDFKPPIPLRSAVANNPTVFSAPAQAQTIWRWNIIYYTGP